ncbi:response regulator [Rhodoferax saidenbachensis]|uniref:Sensory/regulatory protein RpfC n=1 Tax=Rhodoferax saidenbachensis TaxID=1484693 RepID=A0A1P8K8X6_9BURK|nr:response regulator [Rhodoferax saidenbachensis]APW42440.1 hybrid sensor histidine kinase/response regulator [Rhodoferax saidenbachensis]
MIPSKAQSHQAKGRSLHTFLAQVIWLCVTPMVLVAAFLAIDDVNDVNKARNEDAIRLTTNMRDVVDSYLRARINALQMLADTTPVGEPSRLSGLYHQAQAFRKSFGGHVVLASLDTQMLFNTREPFGASLPKLPQPKGRAAVPLALKTGKPAVGDAFMGTIAREPLIAVAMPIMRDGNPQGLLISTFETRQFDSRLAVQPLPDGWTLSIVDSKGEEIARRGPQRARMANADIQDQRFVAASSMSAWTVVLEVPPHIFRAPMLEAGIRLAIAIAGATLVGVIGGLLASRRLGESVASLALPSAQDAQILDIQEISAVRELLDQTAHKRALAEAALRDSAALYQHTLDNMLEGCQIIDFQWRYRYLNAASARQGHQTVEGLIGRTMMQAYPGIEHSATFAMLKRCMEERTAQFGENQFDFPDGTVGWFHINVVPVTEGIAVFSMDVTERKSTELALQASQAAALEKQRQAHEKTLLLMNEAVAARARAESANASLRELSMAVEQSAESIAISTLDGTLEYVNAAYLSTSGYTREELLGHSAIPALASSLPSGAGSGLRAMLMRGEVWKGELNSRRKDGSAYTEFAVISPLRQEDNRITHFVAVKQDVTEKKLLNQELEKHRYHLQELITQSTNELQEARAEADTANQAKSAFLANMSHEIRTPMNAIIGLTWLLRNDTPTPEQAGRLEKIDNAARHLLSIINNILDLSKIEAGKLELERTDFALGSVLDNVRSMIMNQAHAKGLTIEVEGDDLPLWLCGDPTRLRQSLLNFAANAVKFTSQGTVWLRCRVEQESPRGIMIRFEVQDTGIGIAPKDLPSLFNAFAQADVTTSRNFGGTGLGLSITRHLAQLMGGDAGCESQEGHGSTFWFTACLQPGHGPATKDPLKKWTDSATELRQRHEGARLLLVEDNPVNREVATELLRRLGLAVDTAENGLVALEMVQAHAYDLILMDVQMPVMDGLQATRAIRQLPTSPSLPILAMTANAFEEDKRACLAAGMNDFVSKPVIPQDLYTTLLRWLETAKNETRH